MFGAKKLLRKRAIGAITYSYILMHIYVCICTYVCIQTSQYQSDVSILTWILLCFDFITLHLYGIKEAKCQNVWPRARIFTQSLCEQRKTYGFTD